MTSSLRSLLLHSATAEERKAARALTEGDGSTGGGSTGPPAPDRKEEEDEATVEEVQDRVVEENNGCNSVSASAPRARRGFFIFLQTQIWSFGLLDFWIFVGMETSWSPV